MNDRPGLISHTRTVYASQLDGLAYIRDSKGASSNAKFTTMVFVETKDNSTAVAYEVSLFESNSPDHFKETYDDYDKAFVKYNELVLKFKASRNDIS